MPTLTPEQLQEIKYTVYDEVMNRRKPLIYDRRAMPWWGFLSKKAETAGATGGKVIVKLQQDGGLKVEHWDGRQVLTFRENRVDSELEFNYRRSHLGIEFLHTELEDMGYAIEPNASRSKNFAKKMSEAEAHRIMDIFAQRMDDMMDKWDVEHDQIFLVNPTDPLAPIGLDTLMPLDPTTGLFGGKSRSNPLLQHQVRTGSTVNPSGSLERDLNALTRQANINNRGMASRIDFIMAGADWIDAYVDYLKNNGREWRQGDFGQVKRADIGIPDSALYFQDIPIIHNPTFEILDAKGLYTGTKWTKRAYGLASKTWKFFYANNKLKTFSAPMDPPDQRFTRMSLDGRFSLVPTKISGNWINTIA
jgi:hypothetical protein